jgi:hypothetical protein
MAGLPEIVGFRGELLCPEDAGYGPARRLWNGAIDKRPALIARCTSVADLRAGIGTPAPAACRWPSVAAGTTWRARRAATAVWSSCSRWG